MSQPRPSKKELEGWYLSRLQEAYKSFPPGEVRPGERPDFVVHGVRTTGIELTRLFHEFPTGTQPLQEAEQLRRRVVAKAEENFAAAGGPVLMVSVQFVSHARLSKATVGPLAERLSALVRANPPASGERLVVEYDWINRDTFPEELSWVSIASLPQLTRSSWQPVGAGYVPTITPPVLQEAIDRKRQDAHIHRATCQEAWLVVVADGFGISSTFTFGDEAQNHVYESSFDRTLFFENFSRRAHLLNTRPPSTSDHVPSA